MARSIAYQSASMRMFLSAPITWLILIGYITTSSWAYPSHDVNIASAKINVHRLQSHLDQDLVGKLHKFDLFVDPLCEQIPSRITDIQLKKFYSQLNRFSQNVSSNSLNV